jgi:glycosyltransferase 2 family protein
VRLQRALTWILGPTIALALLWFSFRGVDQHELLRQVRGANPWLLAVNLTAAPLHLLLRSWRWRGLLHEVRPRIPMREAFSATAIGYLAGVLPARIGEVLRPTLLSRRVQIPFAPTLATVGVERVILDLLVVLIFGAVGLWLPSSLTGIDLSNSPDWVLSFRRIGAIVLVAMVAALVAVHELARRRNRVTARLESVADGTTPRPLAALLRWFVALLPGFATLSRWRGLSLVLTQSLLIWLVTAAGMHAGIAACGVALPPAGMLVILPIVIAGISIPTPGNTGTFHLAMKLALVSFFGADEVTAVGVALVVHLCNWLPLMLLGGLSLALGGGLPSAGSLLADTEGAR